MRICGIDEAGRGSMVGPLVIAGVATDREADLREMGARDSKELSPDARNELYDAIKGMADTRVETIQPAEIDRAVRHHGLNGLEARHMASIARALGGTTTYVDSCDVDADRFGRTISRISGRAISSHHRADSQFPVVSAASIIAKVERDRVVDRLGIGSGYPSDPESVRFLRSYYERNGEMPAYARQTWQPVRQIMGPMYHKLLPEGQERLFG